MTKHIDPFLAVGAIIMILSGGFILVMFDGNDTTAAGDDDLDIGWGLAKIYGGPIFLLGALGASYGWWRHQRKKKR